jgi:uncharacterized oxidoreductase
MVMKLDGKLALVTGGSDGIGLEIARHLEAKGASVIVAGRNEERLASARTKGFEAVKADLSSEAGCDALIDAVRGRPIDILVNNAGVGTNYVIGEPIDPADVDRSIFLNFNAPIRLIALLIDTLRARPEAAIVNVTSGLAIAPTARQPVYCGTKAGLRSFTMALREQLKASSVHVIEALPPVVETRMTAENTHKKMPAPECGRQIVAAIERDRAYANVGQTALLNAIYNLSPPIARRVMLRY